MLMYVPDGFNIQHSFWLLIRSLYSNWNWQFDSFWKKIRNGDRNMCSFLFVIWMQLLAMQPV